MTVVALATVLVALAFITFAVIDTVRFVRRTGDQQAAALLHRAYGA